MRQKLELVENHVDDDGNPTGGGVRGTGIGIKWQNGPLGRHADLCKVGEPCVDGCTRVAQNGAFVEGVIEAAKQRLEFFQNPAGPETPAGKFACQANEQAIEHLDAALKCLDARTSERQSREVEGTHVA